MEPGRVSGPDRGWSGWGQLLPWSSLSSASSSTSFRGDSLRGEGWGLGPSQEAGKEIQPAMAPRPPVWSLQGPKSKAWTNSNLGVNSETQGTRSGQ